MKKILMLVLLSWNLMAQDEVKTDKKKDRGPFDFALSYTLTSDYADKLDPRIYQHTYNAGFYLNKVTPYKINFIANLGLYYKTLGASIWADHSTGSSGMEFTSLFLGASKNRKFKYFDGKLSLRNSFFLSDEDRYEGHRAITKLSASVSKSFFGKVYTLSNTISGSYLFTEYSYSPTGSGANTKYFFSYTLNNSIRINKYLRLNGGLSFKRSYKYDDFTNNSFMSYGEIKSRYKKFSLSIKYSNGDFLHRDNIRLWYIDQYRKVVSVTLGFVF